MSDNIECKLDGKMVPHIGNHLKKNHPDYTIEMYKEAYPDAPLMSPTMEKRLEEKRKSMKSEDDAKRKAHALVERIIPRSPEGTTESKPLHEIFEMPLCEKLRGKPKTGGEQGNPISMEVLKVDKLTSEDKDAIPEVDDSYVFRVDELKNINMAIFLNIPLLVWGPHGAGKTTVVEQICARLNRPMLRVQHTDTTEEAHIVGQMVVRDGATEFDYGPLAEAMMRGWVYLADEYDFAHPAVIAVYQAVLEGKPLYIKEAPPSQRLVKPHPHFRFIATGNTNGSGDNTGLYQGTKIGNAAAYSRFGITLKVEYPEKKTEVNILRSSLPLPGEVAEKLVDFAERVRDMYSKGELSIPISPRELLRAASIGIVKGGEFRIGIDLAYANRLDEIEQQAVSDTAQRVFG